MCDPVFISSGLHMARKRRVTRYSGPGQMASRPGQVWPPGSWPACRRPRRPPGGVSVRGAMSPPEQFFKTNCALISPTISIYSLRTPFLPAWSLPEKARGFGVWGCPCPRPLPCLSFSLRRLLPVERPGGGLRKGLGAGLALPRKGATEIKGHIIFGPLITIQPGTPPGTPPQSNPRTNGVPQNAIPGG